MILAIDISMKENLKYGCVIVLLALDIIVLNAQHRILIHSHNDYEQRVPFYHSYAHQVASIEVDIFATSREGELLVAHNPGDLGSAPTIDDTYIKPLVNLFSQNNGKAWNDSDNTLILLVDLKTPSSPTLDWLIAKLQAYPEVFDPTVNPYAVQVVISGSRPDPGDFSKYPDIVSFDGDRLTGYTPDQLNRVAMISLAFHNYSRWNGKGTMIKSEYRQVTEAINAAHALGKPIRFWGTPDGVTAWNTFHNIGVDYINTDRPDACTGYFSYFDNKNYRIGMKEDMSGEIARAKRLDKATVGFSGFNNKSLQLSKGISVYTPTYKNDGARKRIKNVILLIGDGTGLAQLQAGATVNNAGYLNKNGLSIFNLKYIGLQDTSSKDAYTTDSAAGGSALATGELHNNRHISTSETGKPYLSITDVMHDAGYACGVITLGNVADATPAAFYGHAVDRDNSDELTAYLLEGKLTVLNGAGMPVFTKRNDGRDLLLELSSRYRISTSVKDIDADDKKVICIDETMDNATTGETLHLLADATRRTINKLSKVNKKGFFLMVEGAKIDYAGHANSLPGSILETFSFDLAVAEVLKFADSNGETLVVVTGDHETGGLTLVDGNVANGHLTARYMTDDHTPLMLPVFAYGPGASEFIGVYKNTRIFHKIKKLLRL